MSTALGHRAYHVAREAFGEVGVDTEAAMARLDRIPVAMNCWQGDDVRGFEDPHRALSGGIQATGNHPGRARTPDELRADAELAMSLIPGPVRFTLTDRRFDLTSATDRRLNPGVSGEQPQKSHAHQPVRHVSQANFGCAPILACASATAAARTRGSRCRG